MRQSSQLAALLLPVTPPQGTRLGRVVADWKFSAQAATSGGMCNLSTYKLSRDEIRGQMEHYELVGVRWTEALKAYIVTN